MRERPILFSAPMVREILADRKTQTRRVADMDKLIRADVRDYGPEWDEHVWSATANAHVRCPYGQPGDRLWVRETFSPFAIYSAPVRIDAASYVVLADGTQVYRDGAIVPGLAEYAPGAADHIRWRPSIHMPRWASRLTLEVTSVRVERLQDITEDDARAEGAAAEPSEALADSPVGLSAREAFADLWSSINGSESWAANPFVWVVGFKRIEVRHG